MTVSDWSLTSHFSLGLEDECVFFCENSRRKATVSLSFFHLTASLKKRHLRRTARGETRFFFLRQHCLLVDYCCFHVVIETSQTNIYRLSTLGRTASAILIIVVDRNSRQIQNGQKPLPNIDHLQSSIDAVSFG